MERRRILELKKLAGTPGGIRTPDPLLRRQAVAQDQRELRITGSRLD